MKKIRGFTMVELLVVVVIVGILAAVSIPIVKGYIIRAKMAELYTTVGAIRTAEDIFYMEHGFYAAQDDEVAGYNLPYSTSQSTINNFMTILGLEIPGMDSVFVYGVYYDPAKIYVRVREHFDWHILCYIDIEGPNRGRWTVVSAHPWSKYVSKP